MPDDCELHASIHVITPETSSIGITEPNEQLADDDSRDDRTAPSTPPQGSPRRGSPRPLGLISPQTWPKYYGEETASEERKTEIDELDDWLVKQGQKQEERRSRSNTPSLGVRDATDTNSSFLTSGARRSATLQQAPSVVSDAGDQEWKRREGHKQAASRQAIYSQPENSTPQNQKSDKPGRNRPHKHQLQAQLRRACQGISNPMSNGYERTFLPKKQLYALINPESVACELAKQSGRNKDDAAIREVANLVCTDQTKPLPGGIVKTLSYRPIFAILVFIEEPSSIELFMKDGVSDLDLPLVENEDPDLHDPGDNSLYRANEKRERQGKPLNCCEHWGPERRKQFCEYQWMLLSPFFCRSAYNHVNHYTLKDHHLLPFIKYGSGLSDGANIHKVHGGFSQVFFVHIHPEHHEFDDDDLDAERGFAVKQLTDEGHHANEKFKKEVNMLKKFTGDGAHSHVVSVLATYEQFGRFHLIFHRANGDLFNYWKRICPSPKFDYATVVWVAKQLAGLADGLYRFHRHYTTPKTSEADQSSEDTNEKDHKNRPKDIFEENILTGTKCTRFQGDQLPHTTNKAARPTQEDLITQYGRHGDLKPENLLWFPHRGDEKGILKIIDFGQAELHSENSKTYRQSRGIDTLTYRPPEGEIQPLMMRQSSDIWSLGCIYLEFVTWMFDGAEGVQSFKTSRLSYDPHLRMKSDKFFECVTVSGFEHDGAQLKHSVSKHIEDLASRADCSEYFKDVLGLIRDMLVIEPSEDHPPPNRRKCCGEVRNFLEKAYEKCLKTRSYAMGG